jgi:hypothetical protein
MDGTRSERKTVETRLHERNCSTHNQKTTRHTNITADTDATNEKLQIEKHEGIQKEQIQKQDIKQRNQTVCENCA